MQDLVEVDVSQQSQNGTPDGCEQIHQCHIGVDVSAACMASRSLQLLQSKGC